jgi:hypothetical protein
MSQPYAQTLDDLLSDSLIRAVMRADHVEAKTLKRELEGVAATIKAGRRATILARPRPFAQLRLPPPDRWAVCATGLCG